MLQALHVPKAVVRRRGRLSSLGRPPRLHPVQRRAILCRRLHVRLGDVCVDRAQRHCVGGGDGVDGRGAVQLQLLAGDAAGQHGQQPGLRERAEHGGVGLRVGRRLLHEEPELSVLESGSYLCALRRWNLRRKSRRKQLGGVRRLLCGDLLDRGRERVQQLHGGSHGLFCWCIHLRQLHPWKLCSLCGNELLCQLRGRIVLEESRSNCMFRLFGGGVRDWHRSHQLRIMHRVLRGGLLHRRCKRVQEMCNWTVRHRNL
mmetsp:Transcript_89071/g.237687  ORF Transcript_89071/g.237687 Transcript_89071/m.237687 type:complete len:258 (+) Transcript_89071:278-1051(+)